MKKLLLMTIAAITFAAAASEAYITPGNPPPPPPWHHGPGPGHGGPWRPYPPSRPPGPPAPPPNYGSFSVPVYVNRQMAPNDRVDIGQYINLYQYQGYRLVAVDVAAYANYNTALVNVIINGFQAGPTMNVGPYAQTYRAIPNGPLYIGQGADSIVLYTQGELVVQQVVLQLSR